MNRHTSQSRNSRSKTSQCAPGFSNMHAPALLLLLLLAAIAARATAQGLPSPSPFPNESLYDRVFPVFNQQGANAPATALFPSSILFVETPIAVRYALFFATFGYDLLAACDPVALSFFGVKDPIPASFCEEGSDARAKIYGHGILRAIEQEFPQEAAAWAQYIDMVGLDSKDTTVDQNTPIGWGNVLGSRHAEFFAKDGLNSLGDVTRTNYRQRFADSSGYTPENLAHLPPDRLRKPLRWQPLTGEADRHGRFMTQVHVVPHIGSKIKPLLLSEEQFAARTVPGPYDYPNSKYRMSESDRKTMEGLIDELLETSATLSPSRLFSARWWENKFVSLGFFPAFYKTALNLNEWDDAKNLLGEMMSQWTAVEVAWKEKVRHDLVRPTTMIRRFRGGQNITAYIDDSVGVGTVSGNEWEPIIPIQPHSEYPSASALLCTASLEHTQHFMQRQVGPNGTIPRFSQTFTQRQVAFPLPEPVKVEFATPAEAADDCGISRLWAGVHFSPSVPAGKALGTGIGKLAFDHVTDLIEGRIPEVCARCKN